MSIGIIIIRLLNQFGDKAHNHVWAFWCVYRLLSLSRPLFLSPTLLRRLSFAIAVSAHTEDKDKSINKSLIRNTTWISACGISWNLGVRAGRLMINYEDGAVFIAVIFPQRTCLLAPGLKMTLLSSPLFLCSFCPSITTGDIKSKWHMRKPGSKTDNWGNLKMSESLHTSPNELASEGRSMAEIASVLSACTKSCNL